jgi:hypothetical protein
MTYLRDPKLTYRTSLREMVSRNPATLSAPLPLTHVTDCIRLPAILKAEELTPRMCSVFGDKRLYTFYARPAYRGSKKGPLHNLNFAPVCFIIDPSATSACHPVAVFPFDTGALNRGLLADDVHPELSPYDFALEPTLDSAQRLAGIFFGDAKGYYSGRSNKQHPPKFSPFDAEIVAYDSLVRRGGNTSRDERATSIEVQFKDPLPLAGKVIGIFLPQDFLDVPEIVSFTRKANKAKIDVVGYPFILDHGVKEVVGIFYTLAEQLYASKKKKHGWKW